MVLRSEMNAVLFPGYVTRRLVVFSGNFRFPISLVLTRVRVAVLLRLVVLCGAIERLAATTPPLLCLRCRTGSTAVLLFLRLLL